MDLKKELRNLQKNNDYQLIDDIVHYIKNNYDKDNNIILIISEFLNKWNKQYNLFSISLVEDRVYDKLYDVIYQIYLQDKKIFKKKFPSVSLFDSVNDVISSGKDREQMNHHVKMLSLENGFTVDDIEKFIKDTKSDRYICEQKIDGVSINLVYKNGELKYAITRGNGEIGEVITENIKTIKDIPININSESEHLEIRGEIYMSKTDFEKLNHEKEQSNEKLFSNPRNATTGSLMHLDVNVTASRNLSFFAYSMYDINEFYNFKYHSDCLNLLHDLGFKVNQYNKIVHSKNEILQYYNEAIDYRYNLNYDIDGIVYKVDSLLEQKQLGSTGKYPKWAIAYKFPAEIALSKIKDIVIQVGRTGVLTPVAILDSVNIGGVMVSKASLHNQDEINRKDIRIGDIVEVKRAGDVIPYVEKVILDKRTHNLLQFQFPKNCPVCGSLVEKNGIKIFCNNKFECKSQKIEAICHFVSKPAFNIQGLGKKQVEQLYNISILNNISDIFELDDKKKIILQQEGWGILSFNNLIDSINKSKEVELYRFIYALGVPNVGIESAKLLANHFKDINKLIEVISIIRQSDFEYNRLSSINGFGNIVLDNIIDFFNNENNIKQIYNILEYINIAKVEEIKEVVADEFFNKKKFVISGTYDNFSRDYIKEQILLRGGKVITSVSKSLDYLIAGDNVGVKKLDKANELNIKIITKEDILSRLKLL